MFSPLYSSKTVTKELISITNKYHSPPAFYTLYISRTAALKKAIQRGFKLTQVNPIPKPTMKKTFLSLKRWKSTLKYIAIKSQTDLYNLLLFKAFKGLNTLKIDMDYQSKFSKRPLCYLARGLKYVTNLWIVKVAHKNGFSCLKFFRTLSSLHYSFDYAIDLMERDHHRFVSILVKLRDLKVLNLLNSRSTDFHLNVPRFRALNELSYGSCWTYTQIANELVSLQRLSMIISDAYHPISKNLFTTSSNNLTNMSLRFEEAKSLNDTDLSLLSTQIPCFHSLKNLEITVNRCPNISSPGIERLTQAIKMMKSLTSLSLELQRIISIKKISLEDFFSGIALFSSLTSLALCFDGDDLVDSRSLRYLNMVCVQKLISLRLCFNSGRHIFLSKVVSNLSVFSAGLTTLHSLRNLQLNFNNYRISSKDMSSLYDSVCSLPELSILYLTIYTGRSFFRLLSVFKNMEKLSILGLRLDAAAGQFQDSELDQLISAIKSLPRITNVTVYYKISEEKKNKFIRELRGKSSINALYIGETTYLLEQNKDLQYPPFMMNGYGPIFDGKDLPNDYDPYYEDPLQRFDRGYDHFDAPENHDESEDESY